MQVDPLLITRFLRNECNEDEKVLVAAYLDEHPEVLEQYLGEAEWAGFDAGEMMEHERSSRMKERVMNAIRKPAKTKRISYQKLAVAATVCGLLSVSVYLWWQHRSSVQATESIAALTDNNKMIIISNPSAEEKPLRMADGSLVIVAAHSTVRYPKEFRSNRTVQLEGSALFDVAKDDAHPFRVNAGVLQVTVLGTRFRIDADKGNRDMNVKLFSGKIRVGVGEKETDLLPGREFHYQQGIWTVRTFEHHKKNAAPGAIAEKDNTAPLSDALVFDNRPLSVVLATLQARFNTPIHYNNKMIRKYYFSGEFNATDSLDQILKTICTLNGLQIKEDSTGYTLLPDKK
jgi:ferric-dicitrate binding protein FerR (iron transport regulator)